MSSKHNEELIQEVKDARDLNKRQILAQAIACLDERVVEVTAAHDVKIATMMGKREKLFSMMDEYVPSTTLDMIIAEFNQ